MIDSADKREYFAIFGGGGIRGLAYCGAYKALAENNIRLTGCAGSSIGAVFAGLLSLGYDFEEIFEILSSTGFDMFIDINFDFKKELALSKGNIFLDWMREKIESKFYGDIYQKDKMPPVTFNDIKTVLIIYSVDLVNMKFKEFSKTKTPDFEVAKAIRASVSMPGLFTPLELDDKLIVDGDLLKSTPLWRNSNSIKNLEERILEFRLEDNETPRKVTNSIEYINRVYNAICGFATDYIIDLYNEKDKFDYIKIDTPNVSVVDFLISKEKRRELFDIGYERTSVYLKEFLPAKQQKLQKKYNELLSHLLRFQKVFLKNKYTESYLYLCEMFIFLCEEKKYLDSNIYKKILDFKNMYLENIVEKGLFKSKKINNQKQLNDFLLEIVKTATLKVTELKNV